jgi:hypothetical protein
MNTSTPYPQQQNTKSKQQSPNDLLSKNTSTVNILPMRHSPQNQAQNHPHLSPETNNNNMLMVMPTDLLLDSALNPQTHHNLRNLRPPKVAAKVLINQMVGYGKQKRSSMRSMNDSTMIANSSHNNNTINGSYNTATTGAASAAMNHKHLH